MEAEAREQEKTRKMMLIGAVVVAVMGIGIAIWVLM